MISLKEISESVLQLMLPHTCAGCGSDQLNTDSSLCLECLHHLPATHYANKWNNPVERKFVGRLPLFAASAHYYFSKQSIIQQLMHLLKYRGYTDLGNQLGQLMGKQLIESGRFDTVDMLVPLPLSAARYKQRGYNQAMVLCEGISAASGIPVRDDILQRDSFSSSQTKKGRVDRWLNIEGSFSLSKNADIRNKHILLVDDVVTTGATLESGGAVMLREAGVLLSIATLCYVGV